MPLRKLKLSDRDSFDQKKKRKKGEEKKRKKSIFV